MEPYILDFEKLEVYEAGAILLSVLAFPKDDKKGTRAKLHGALCALGLRELRNLDGEWANSYQKVRPIYASFPDGKINQAVRTLDRRLRDRMVCARMAMAYLQKVVTGQRPKLPQYIGRLSTNQLGACFCADAGQSDPENFLTRVWRPSFPVIHIAAALQSFMAEYEKQRGPSEPEQVHTLEIVTQRHIIELIVTRALEYETLLRKSEHLEIGRDDLVSMRLS